MCRLLLPEHSAAKTEWTEVVFQNKIPHRLFVVMLTVDLLQQSFQQVAPRMLGPLGLEPRTI